MDDAFSVLILHVFLPCFWCFCINRICSFNWASEVINVQENASPPHSMPHSFLWAWLLLALRVIQETCPPPVADLQVQVLLLSSFSIPGMDFIRQGGNVPLNKRVSWKSGGQQSGGRILTAGANKNTVCRLPPSGAIPIVDMSCVLCTMLHTGLLPSLLIQKTPCSATRWDCLSSPSWSTSFRHSTNPKDDESSDSFLCAR